MRLIFPFTLALIASAAMAQDTSQTDTESPEPTDAAVTEAAANEEALLSTEELETLLAPVALYPDTVLIQVLVAATVPVDVVKADRLLLKNAEAPQEDLEGIIKNEGFDPSVEVLALAFPDVISDMAEHLEWTETMGTVMLAQSDDVMDTVQELRAQAVANGALQSTEEQTVEVEEDETVIIQPADPEVVYVPTYNPEVVYDDGFSATDAVVAGAMTFVTVSIIDDIFDDDDDWNGYWGCHNCGGWDDGPIIHDPDIDISVDGDVNIGNDVDIDRPDLGWKPDDDKVGDAKDKLADRRDENGNTRLPVDRPPRKTDDLRASLSDKAGSRDISKDIRPEGGLNRDAQRPSAGSLPQIQPRPQPKKPSNASRDKLKKNAGNQKANLSRPANKPKPKAKPAARPAAKPKAKPATRQAARPANKSRAKPKKKKNHAMKKKSGGGKKAHKAKKRGGGKGKGRRR